MSRFQDKVAIVTGAAGGIGLATAKRLASEGARLVLVDLDEARVQAMLPAVLQCGAPEAMAAGCDVSQELQVEATVNAAMSRFGRLDAVVNNAGLMTFKPLQEFSGADWNAVLGVDLLGAFFFIKNAFRHMKPGGAIVNISSIHALQTEALVAPYAAAKAAMLSLTRSAAIEGKELGIRTNAILPGAIETPMLRNNPQVKSGVEHLSASDVGKPEDIAAVVAYLASDDAAFVQGACLTVDGGRLAGL
ncbi:MAG: SDR family oxidoreductase [Ramlibacter sp.]|nr:SDR family oxidoreductase [Ramlibacter sp.]